MRSSLTWIGVLTAVAASAVAAEARSPAGFGVSGVVRTDFGAYDVASSIVVQRDGRIVVAGQSGSADGRRSDIALARFTQAGLLDRSFGIAGMVLPASPLPPSQSYVFAVALQADGKLDVARDGGKPAVIRYRSDGTRDRSFGRVGTAVTPNSGSLAVQRDGKIVIAGRGFALTRMTPAGKLDRTFGANGNAEQAFGPDTEGDWTAVAIQHDGRIVTAGFTEYSFALARYNRDGSLDHSFGNGNGWVKTRFDAIKRRLGDRGSARRQDRRRRLTGLALSLRARPLHRARATRSDLRGGWQGAHQLRRGQLSSRLDHGGPIERQDHRRRPCDAARRSAQPTSPGALHESRAP